MSADKTPTEADLARIRGLIDRSSIGQEKARRLWKHFSPEEVERIAALVAERDVRRAELRKRIAGARLRLNARWRWEGQ